MKKVILLILCLPLINAFSQGSGNAIDLGANAANLNLVNCGMLPLTLTDFTIEFWMKSETVTGDPAIFSNKDWNSGNNVGLVVFIQGDGSELGVNLKGSTGPRKDLSFVSPLLTSQWNHVALTVDRDGFLYVYQNGIEKGSLDISESTGDLTESLPFMLGQDGTGIYGSQFNGKIDDFRVWNSLRTETEIRQNMCQKLTGSEANLLLNYDFDNDNTTTINDLTTNSNDGVTSNFVASNFVSSGAAIGNVSVFAYSPSITSQLNLTGISGTTKWTMESGSTQGVHFYKINEVPSSTLGISNLLTNNEYYGVFMIEPDLAEYSIEYDYTIFSEAQANENSIVIYERMGNEVLNWVPVSNPNQDLNLNLIDFAKNSSTEFILGFAVCENPFNLSLTTVEENSATISWDGNSANSWNIEYGVDGFVPNQVADLTSNSQTVSFSSLSPGTNYDVYVQAVCDGGSLSEWIGPLDFQTLTDNTSSLSQFTGKTNLQVFPNPVLDIITIRTSQRITNVKMYNLLGMILDEKQIDYLTEVQIDLSEFKSGAYQFIVNTENGINTIKVLKK